MFIHRNVANMVLLNDLNMLTALTYAVDYLKVRSALLRSDPCDSRPHRTFGGVCLE